MLIREKYTEKIPSRHDRRRCALFSFYFFASFALSKGFALWSALYWETWNFIFPAVVRRISNFPALIIICIVYCFSYNIVNIQHVDIQIRYFPLIFSATIVPDSNFFPFPDFWRIGCVILYWRFWSFGFLWPNVCSKQFKFETNPHKQNRYERLLADKRVVGRHPAAADPRSHHQDPCALCWRICYFDFNWFGMIWF